MPRTEKNAALEHFLVAAGSEMGRMIEDISTEDILAAADRIIACRERGGRVHVSGIGKPGHVAGYAASLLSSTGTPSYVLDGTEAVHGSSGQTVIVAGDHLIGAPAYLRVAFQALLRIDMDACHHILREILQHGDRVAHIAKGPVPGAEQNALMSRRVPRRREHPQTRKQLLLPIQ